MATRLVPVLFQVVDCDGNPADGWKLYFYETGTTTLKDTFSNTALTVANANPVVCNSDGRPANGAGAPVDIFGVNKEDFKVVLTTAVDVVVVTDDPIDTITYDINSFGTRPDQHWGTTTGTAAAFLIKPDPSVTAYTDDIRFSIQMSLDNNAGSTLAVFQEGTVSTYLAALDMMKYDNAGAKTALEAGDNQAGQTYLYRIDGTDAVCLNPGIVQYSKNNKFNFNQTTATIASGIITIDSSNMVVDGEGAAADDLVTINGGATGDILILSPANAARPITLKHGTGNILISTNTDVVLANANDKLILVKTAGNWTEFSRSVDTDFKTGSGYYYLPNNKLTQYGKYTGGAHGPTITYPIAFDSIDSVVGIANAAAIVFGVTGVDATDFVGNQYSLAGAQTLEDFYWVAIGTKAQ